MYEYTYEVLSPGGLFKIIYGKRGTSVVVVASGSRNDKGEYNMVYINQNWGSNRNIDLLYIPKKERTYNICTQAIQNGLGLCYVPEILRDKEICMLALVRNKSDFSFVPDMLQLDPDIIKLK
jgi:hypothetical protein